MRTIRKNIYGNWKGYEGKRLVQHFGESEYLANYWLETGRMRANDAVLWRYDAPVNPAFRGADRPVAGEEY